MIKLIIITMKQRKISKTYKNFGEKYCSGLFGYEMEIF